jgi:quercetin dioxygenase-like cupin family protein
MMIRFIALIAATAFTVLLPLLSQAEEPTVVGSPAEIKWVAAPPAAGLPEGAEVAFLYGNPGKEGPFVIRVKYPAGYKMAAHVHTADYNVTVLSGTLYFALGDKLDTHGALKREATRGC